MLALAPLPASAAQELLADRIGAADAAAAPGPQDRDLLAAIAHRLDGLPLALELAAVRAPAVGLPALLQALERPLDALQVRRRGVEARHRSLRDVVQWSYQLLDPDEQALFVQMAVFAGPVEAGTVQAVCGGATVLPDLVDRSLVRRLPGEPASYDLLETLRAFGREQLATDPGTPQLRRRHAAWAVELAADVRAARTRPDEANAVRRFDLQLADLRRAHGWLCEHGPVDGLLTLALAFADLGFLRARADLVQLAGQGLAAAGHDPADPDLDPARGHRHPLVPVVISTFAQSRWQSGDLDGARRLAQRAIAVAERLGDPTLGADAYDVLANVTSFAGEEDQSLDLMRRGLALARATGNRHAEALCLTDLLVGAGYSRDQALALRVEQEAVELADELGSASVRAWVAYGRGEWRAELGVPGAAEHLERAVQLAGEVDAAFIAGVARHTLLTTAARSAEADWPLAAFRPLIDTWHGLGTWTMLWLAIRALVDALSRRGRHREVALLLGALRASPLAPVLIGPDLERAERAEGAARSALGERFEQVLAEGAALGDAGAVALAHELTAGDQA